jgi:energy-coupling factor transport system ATP-binding protein
VPVLSGLELRVEPGERVLLAGPSGAGKSTLLRAAAGVLGSGTGGDQTGRVLLSGGGQDPSASAVGLLPQNPNDSVVADRVGRDVAFGPENLGLPREEIWRRTYEALRLVGFPYDVKAPTTALSGGERQRLALAGALALRPGLLLLDEPTSMLDADAASALREAVGDVVELTGATLLVVAHRLEPWLRFVDRMIVLGADGAVLCDGDPRSVLEQHGDRLVRAGVWVPGRPDPEPLQVPAELLRSTFAAELPSDEPLVEAEQLLVRLRTRTLRGARERVALRDVDATVPAAEVTALTGPSGAGKSTLLGALAGLVPLQGGRVAASPQLCRGLGSSPHRWSSAQLAARVGWVPQDAEHGFLTRRVIDEVEVTGQRLGRRVDAAALLHLFGLDQRADADPYRLSGGEQRRLSVLSGLAHRPAMVLLDEPTVGQDRNTWAAVAGTLRGLAAGGCGVAVATHDQALVGSVADRETTLEPAEAGR